MGKASQTQRKSKITRRRRRRSPATSEKPAQKPKLSIEQDAENKIRDQLKDADKQYELKDINLQAKKLMRRGKNSKFHQYNKKQKNWFVILQLINKFQSKQFEKHQEALNKQLCRIFLRVFFPNNAHKQDLKNAINSIYYLIYVPITLVDEHIKNKSDASQIENMLKTIIGQVQSQKNDSVRQKIIKYFVKKSKRRTGQQIQELIKEVPWRIDTIKACAKMLKQLKSQAKDYSKDQLKNLIQGFCLQHYPQFENKKRPEFVRLTIAKIQRVFNISYSRFENVRQQGSVVC